MSSGPSLLKKVTCSNSKQCCKKEEFFLSKYNKLTFKLGSGNKAKVAIANRIARSVYKVLAGDKYKELTHNRVDTNEPMPFP